MTNSSLFSSLTAVASTMPGTKLVIGGNAPVMVNRILRDCNRVQVLLGAQMTEKLRMQISPNVFGKQIMLWIINNDEFLCFVCVSHVIYIICHRCFTYIWKSFPKSSDVTVWTTLLNWAHDLTTTVLRVICRFWLKMQRKQFGDQTLLGSSQWFHRCHSWIKEALFLSEVEI